MDVHKHYKNVERPLHPSSAKTAVRASSLIRTKSVWSVFERRRPAFRLISLDLRGYANDAFPLGLYSPVASPGTAQF